MLKSIKDKVLSLGIITNPTKIGELIDSVRDNLSTDLTVGDLVNMGLNFKDMSNGNIVMYSYNDDCNGICSAGGFLYTPLRENFGNAWVLLPENATKSRLSRYGNMPLFAEIIFTYPHLLQEEKAIRIITNRQNLESARKLRTKLEQLGFPIDHTNAIVQTGVTLENSHIHSYYDTELNTGFDDKSTLIKALKSIEKNIPITFGKTQEYATGTGKFIEIVLGKDEKNYFQFNTNKNTDETIKNNIPVENEAESTEIEKNQT